MSSTVETTLTPTLRGAQRMCVRGTIVYLEYSAIDWSYALHFRGEDLIEVEMIEKFEGISVLFGESIGTDRDILNEICFEIHPSIIEYKKELY